MIWIIALFAIGFGIMISASAALLLLKGIVSFIFLAFLPGYLVLKIIFPARSFDVAVALMSSGLSVSITIVCGLILHAFNAMNAFGWVLCLGFLCLTALWMGIRFRVTGTPTRTSLRFKASHIAAVSLALMLVSSAVVIAKQGSLEQRQFSYTELWILPTDERSFDRVVVGLRNEEQAGTYYDLEILVNDRTIKRWPRFYLKEHDQRVEQVYVNLDGEEPRTLQDRPLQRGRKKPLADNPCKQNEQLSRPMFARAAELDRKPCDDGDGAATEVRFDTTQPGRQPAQCSDKPGATCKPASDTNLLKIKTGSDIIPCDRTAMKVEQRPVMIRGDKKQSPCDQDRKIEARLYKNGDLSFLYRNVWLSRPNTEQR